MCVGGWGGWVGWGGGEWWWWGFGGGEPGGWVGVGGWVGGGGARVGVLMALMAVIVLAALVLVPLMEEIQARTCREQIWHMGLPRGVFIHGPYRHVSRCNATRKPCAYSRSCAARA